MFNLKALSIVVTCLLASAVFSQTAPLPSTDAINLQRKQISDSLNAVDGKDIPTPTNRSAQAAIQSKSYGATANAANEIKGSYQSLSKVSRAQFDNLAKTKMPMQNRKATSGDSDLMIFVSFSMPQEMLMSYTRQAKRFGGVLMMRGFVNDKMSTTKAAIERINEAGVEWQVSPEPFKKFKVAKVPAIVLASASAAESVTQDGCATPDAFTLISGDISVFDALDKMALRGQPKIAVLAKSRLLADRASANQGGIVSR